MIHVYLLNPTEILCDSPRTARFVRALADDPNVEISTIGLGDGLDTPGAHLSIGDTGQMTVMARVLRIGRVMLFVLSALLRVHWLTRLLHSPNRKMPSNLINRRRIRKFISSHDSHVVIARDIMAVPLISGIVFSDRVWIDLPDLTEEVAQLRLVQRLLFGAYFRWLTRCLSQTASQFSTVSDSLADEFKQRHTIHCTVVRNSCPYREPTTLPSRTNSEAACESSPMRLVYVGAAIASKSIVNCLDAIRELGPAFQLDLFLVPTDFSYYCELKQQVGNLPNALIRKPVIPENLVDVLREYDAALVIIPASSINSACTLPNKFFQSVQARLPIITGPSREMAKLVDCYQIGEVAESFKPIHIANACRRLTSRRIAECEVNLETAARKLSDDDDLNTIRLQVSQLFRSI